MSDAQNTSSTTGVHVHTVPVRWSDFDRYGHLMNANYVELAQEARFEFANDYFTSRGLDFKVFVRRIEADYLRPILPDTTEVTVESQVVETGNTSFITRQEVKDRQGRIACVIECVQVAIDMETTTPRSLSEREIKILTRTEPAGEIEAGK